MTQRLRLFPLKTVLFPGAGLNLHIFEPRYRQMISECLDEGEAFGVVLIRDGDEAGDPNVLPHDVGTTAVIDDVTPLPSGRYYISTTGRRRFRIQRIVSREPYIIADAVWLDDIDPPDGPSIQQLGEDVRSEYRQYIQLLAKFTGEEMDGELPDDPVDASFQIGGVLQVGDAMKQRLLELRSTRQRLAVELGFLRRLLPQLRRLLERKAATAEQQARHPDESSNVERARQERYFGKHFSLN